MSYTQDRKMTYHIIIDLLRLYFHLSLSISLSISLHLLFLNKTKRTLLMIWVKSTDPYLNSLFKRFILIMIIANICTMLLFYTCCYYKLTLKFSITSFIAPLLFQIQESCVISSINNNNLQILATLLTNSISCFIIYDDNRSKVFF